MVLFPYHINYIQLYWMPEIGRVAFCLFGRGITPLAALLLCESWDANKLQAELAGRLPGPAILCVPLAVAGRIEIQDALILPVLCYVYVFVYASRGSRWHCVAPRQD